MNRKQTLWMYLGLSSTIVLSALSMNTISVHAVDSDIHSKQQVIDLEINDVNAVNILKEKILKGDSFYQLTQADQNSVKVDAKNSEIKVENLDLTKPGLQEVVVHMKVSYTNGTGPALASTNINEKISINFVDTTAPTITLRYKNLKLDYLEAFDPYEWLESVTDNSVTPITDIKASHEVDSSVSKDYIVNYTATDDSGNIGVASMNVTVKEKPKPKVKVVSSGSTGDSDSITTMLNLMNAARAERGLDPLALGSDGAQSAAAVRAEEAAGYVSHTRPNGTHYKTALDDYGVSYSNPLEILTYSGKSVQAKFDWWMSSTGHRNIILSSSSTTIAIGYSGGMWAAIAYK